MRALKTFSTMHSITAHIHEDNRCERHAEHRRDSERCTFLGSAEGWDKQRNDDGIADECDPRTSVQPCKGSEATAVGDAAAEDTIEEDRRDDYNEDDGDSGHKPR